MTAREQLRLQDLHLLRASVDHARLLEHGALGGVGALARPGHLPPGEGDLLGDALVLFGDRPEVVHLVEDVLEAPRGEEHVQGGRVRLLVDGDEPEVEALDGEPVLALERHEAARLHAQQLVELREPASMQADVALEGAELRGHAADPSLEGVDARGERGDLLRERRLLLLRAPDLLLDGRELGVDARLLLTDVVGRRRGREREREREREQHST